ncbi:hypothetical protein MHYP_G00151800 [Metynnis hypsauchen]
MDTEALEDDMKNMKMGILEVVKEIADPSRSLTILVNVAVVLEEEQEHCLFCKGYTRFSVEFTSDIHDPCYYLFFHISASNFKAS